MKRVLLFFIALAFTYCATADSLYEKLQKGKVLEIKVTPMGDHWGYANDFHEITIFKSDDGFVAELFQKGMRKKTLLTEEELKDILFFVRYWNSDMINDTRSMIHDQVKIKIGFQSQKFKTIQNSDIEILRKYFNDNRTY